ncbi:hypothetical protein AQUCO_00200063v1 [Aquilegia coerulea]|uniref:Embryo defective 2759 n=1 Tax=Aquilegia coerulea TaxID=218851 RepID=A0A2G5F1B8_AQUCA|nr:hypothetical protein AQUCO_00200063v1 [Aquilegia coerulea]
MALITHQTPGSYASFPLRSKLWTKEVKFKPLVSHQLVLKFDRSLSSRRFCLRPTTILPAKVKQLKVSAFKGTGQNDESGGRSNGSKISKNSVKLSYVSHDEETIAKSSDIQKEPFSYSSAGEENIAGSPAIQKLFKKWLMMLRTQSSNQVVDGIFGEGPIQNEIAESDNGSQKQEKGKILKAAWCYFLELDATVKIPLLMFIPWYLAVNVVYGAEVSKELTPLWIFGPVIVALYIKMLQGLCALYVFTFRQTARVLKSSATYLLLVYNYASEGRLKEMYSRIWLRVADFKNLDYIKLLNRRRKQLGEWAGEKNLDFFEAIWPYYCRTIRFLKKANFI